MNGLKMLAIACFFALQLCTYYLGFIVVGVTINDLSHRGVPNNLLFLFFIVLLVLINFASLFFLVFELFVALIGLSLVVILTVVPMLIHRDD